MKGVEAGDLIPDVARILKNPVEPLNVIQPHPMEGGMFRDIGTRTFPDRDIHKRAMRQSEEVPV